MPIKNKKERRKYYAKNRDKILAQNKEAASRRKPARASYASQYRKNNPEMMRSIKAKWKRLNPIKFKLMTLSGEARRRATMLGLLHPEYNRELEYKVRMQAIQMTERTGIKHVVDHIIPIIKGGWHHHLNLQAIPRQLNESKAADPIWEHEGYKSWRDVPEYLWPDRLRSIYNRLK